MKFLALPLAFSLLVGSSISRAADSKKLSSEETKFLRAAFTLAKQSRDEGSHPFGALLVCEGKVFLSGKNHVTQTKNPLRHAETVLLESYISYQNATDAKRRVIAPEFGGRLPDIKACQLYASTQPCQMCEGAAYTMKVGASLSAGPQIIYGLDKGGLSEAVHGQRGHDRSLSLSGPHLLDEAREAHKGFWK